MISSSSYFEKRRQLSVDYFARRDELKLKVEEARALSDPDKRRAALADLGAQRSELDTQYFSAQRGLFADYIKEFNASAYGKLGWFSTSSFSSYTDRRKNLGLDAGTSSGQLTKQTYGPGSKNPEGQLDYGISSKQKEYFQTVKESNSSSSSSPFERRIQADNRGKVENILLQLSPESLQTFARTFVTPDYRALGELRPSGIPDLDYATTPLGGEDTTDTVDEPNTSRRRTTVLPYTFLIPTSQFLATVPRTLAADDALGFSDKYYVNFETGPLASVRDNSIFKPRSSEINFSSFLTLLADPVLDYEAEVRYYRAEMSFIVYGSLVPYSDVDFNFRIQLPGQIDVLDMTVNYGYSGASATYREQIRVRHGEYFGFDQEVDVVDISQQRSLLKVNQWQTLSAEFSGLNVIVRLDNTEIGRYTYTEAPASQAITSTPGCEISMNYTQGGGVGGAVDLGMRNCNFEFL